MKKPTIQQIIDDTVNKGNEYLIYTSKIGKYYLYIYKINNDGTLTSVLTKQISKQTYENNYKLIK